MIIKQNNAADAPRSPRFWAAAVQLLLAALLLGGVDRRLSFHKNKKLTVGVFAGSYWEIENGYPYRILDDAIARFREENPEIEVVYTSGILKSDYSEWLSEQIMQGSAPDLFFVPGNDFGTFSLNLLFFVYLAKKIQLKFYKLYSVFHLNSALYCDKMYDK